MTFPIKNYLSIHTYPYWKIIDLKDKIWIYINKNLSDKKRNIQYNLIYIYICMDNIYPLQTQKLFSIINFDKFEQSL